MHRTRFVLFFTLSVIILAAACAPQPAPAAVPAADTPADMASPIPASTEPPTVTGSAAVGPRLVPPMEVGSTFRYFDGAMLVPVPEGDFTMGNGRDESPIRTVYLSGFWIYSIEVTNRMYALCVSLEKCTPPDEADNPIFDDVREGNKPVVGVTWQQAVDYCDFAHARLPTEAEWEKTARGPEGNTFPWGEDAPNCSLLNFDGCVRKTAFVGNYPDGQSFYKAMDMSGNVFEWVSDWFDPAYYAAAPTQDPPGAEAGTKKSVRSSAFGTDGFLTEAARRSSANPEDHRADLGFRCVVEDPAYFAPFCTQLLVYGTDAPGGAGSGESIGEQCNQPIIEQKLLNCTQTNVWVDGNGGGVSSTLNLDSCIDQGEQMVNGTIKHLYTCSGPARPIDACGNCSYPSPSGAASCPPGYQQQGEQCEIEQGSTGQCPEGSTYDPALMCCSVTTGNGTSYNLCPPGYSYVPGGSPNDPGACVNYVAGGIKCDPQTLNFKEGCGGKQPDCEENPDDPACGPPGGCDPATNPTCGPGSGPCPNGGKPICDTQGNCRCP